MQSREDFKTRIGIDDGFIRVDGIGRIGMYSSFDKAILLDFSMKYIVGINERIPCERSEIKNKICDLFLDTNKIIRAAKLRKLNDGNN